MATTPRPENPWMRIARLKKATKLLRHLSTLDTVIPSSLLAQAPAGWWALLAKRAGVNVPSPETTALVVELVRERETEAASVRRAS